MQGELRASISRILPRFLLLVRCSPTRSRRSCAPLRAPDPNSSVDAGSMQEGTTEGADGLEDEGRFSATGEQSNRIVTQRRIEGSSDEPM
jgi:hypothetical protein